MTRQQVRGKRNAGHRERQAALLAAAPDDAAALSAAFDWFRSSVRLMERRNAFYVSKDTRMAAAARLMREMTTHLKHAAEAIDRGDYDPERR